MIYVVLTDRLGNNLFQVGAALSITPQVTLVVESSEAEQQIDKYGDSFFSNLSIVDSPPKGVPVYQESRFNFDKIPYVPGKPLVLRGYFQSYKYLKRDVAIKQFGPSESTKLSLISDFPFLNDPDCVSVHVRRGDYLKATYEHPVCGASFFAAARTLIGEDKNFVVMSDDIDWCKRNFRGGNVEFMEGTTDVTDLYVASLCSAHIISNSSFGWWGAYLASLRRGCVIAPTPWFGFRSKADTRDLLPEEWLTIGSGQTIGKNLFARIQFLSAHIRYKLAAVKSGYDR